MALSAGDIGDCRTTAAKLFVVTHDDKFIEVSSRNSPLTVPGTPEPPTLIENIRSMGHEMPVAELTQGQYRLSVSDSSGSDSIPVSVVPENRQPDVVDSLADVPIPDSIRDRYRARVLASYPDWRLQGLSMISERSIRVAGTSK